MEIMKYLLIASFIMIAVLLVIIGKLLIRENKKRFNIYNFNEEDFNRIYKKTKRYNSSFNDYIDDEISKKFTKEFLIIYELEISGQEIEVEHNIKYNEQKHKRRL